MKNEPIGVWKIGDTSSKKVELCSLPRLFVVMQKSEALRVWEIGRRKVIEAIGPKTKDVLKVGGTSDNVTDGVACALYGDQIRGWKVRQNLNEYFRRKTEKGARQRHVGGNSLTAINLA